MDKKVLQQVSGDNADKLVRQIHEDAEAQIREIVGKQSKDANLIIQQAQIEAQRKKVAALAVVEKELEKFREKAHSALNLEKRRLQLEGKSSFVQAVIDEVKRGGEALRSSPAGPQEYAEFLRQAIVEGALVVESEALEIFFSGEDKHIVTPEFTGAVTQLCSQALHLNCRLKMTQGDFKDTGVIVATQDGRMIFDNRFTARLGRIYDEIYSALLKEA
jgi:vacuolar-type H+-ATPase subunit E/Vma4